MGTALLLMKNKSWTCRKCTLINPLEMNVCSACSCSQLYSGLKSETSENLSCNSSPSKDYWTCSQCTLLNPNRLAKCRACKSPISLQPPVKVLAVKNETVRSHFHGNVVKARNLFARMLLERTVGAMPIRMA